MLKIIKIKFNILLKSIAKIFGINLKMTSEESFMRLLKHHNIDLIIDVGANIGQFASMCFALGYKGRIVSIEPLSRTHEILKSKASKKTSWEVFDKIALGNEEGEIEINVSKNTVSSSILNLKESHINSSPDSIFINKEKTRIQKLDNIYNAIKKESKNVFLKIDTQGYEDAVLEGASKSLNTIKGVQLEMSLVSLYEGQLLMSDLIDKMTKTGFKMVYIDSGFVDQNTGQVLQAEGVFFREG